MKYIIVLALLGLTGCAGGLTGTGAKNEFSCELPKGVNCFSVQSAYHLSLNGKLPGQQTQMQNEELIYRNDNKEEPVSNNKNLSEAISDLWNFNGDKRVAQTINLVSNNERFKEGPDIQFTPPQYVKIWIAPYKTANGDIRDAYYMYSKIKEGSWKVQAPISTQNPPVLEVKKEVKTN